MGHPDVNTGSEPPESGFELTPEERFDQRVQELLVGAIPYEQRYGILLDAIFESTRVGASPNERTFAHVICFEEQLTMQPDDLHDLTMERETRMLRVIEPPFINPYQKIVQLVWEYRYEPDRRLSFVEQIPYFYSISDRSRIKYPEFKADAREVHGERALTAEQRIQLCQDFDNLVQQDWAIANFEEIQRALGIVAALRPVKNIRVPRSLDPDYLLLYSDFMA